MKDIEIVIKNASFEGLGAYLSRTDFEKEKALILVSIDSIKSIANQCEGITEKEILIETLAHEFIHVLEDFLNINHSESRAEELSRKIIYNKLNT